MARGYRDEDEPWQDPRARREAGRERSTGGGEPVAFPSCTIVGSSAKAIRVYGVPKRTGGFWIPKVAVHDDSDIYINDRKQELGPGKLVLKRWFVDRENLEGGK